MSNPFLDALGWVGQSLDKPGAAVRGLLAGRPDQLANLIPFSDTLGITDPSQRTRGTDLLGLDPDTTGGMLGGMGAEIATDPLNLLMGAGLLRNLGRGRAMQEGYRGAQAGYEAAEAARQPLVEAAGRAEANNALRRELLGTGGMPEEVAMQTKAVDASGQPVRTYHGTGAVYDKYDPAMDKGTNLWGPGYYTTEDTLQGVPSGYAGNMQRRAMTAGEREAAQRELEGRIEAAAAADPGRAETLKGLAQLPNNELMTTVAMRRALREAGIPYQDLYPHTAPNVRMQFLDYRNPFVAESQFPPEEVQRLFGLAEQRLGPMSEPAHHVLSYSDLAALERGESLPGGRLYEGLSDTPYLSASRPNFEPDKALANELLQQGGYDAIRHIGGGNTGNLPHQVHIAFRPEQIYNPWIAPMQQAMPMVPPPSAVPLPPQLPRQSPLLGALGIQATLGRAG